MRAVGMFGHSYNPGYFVNPPTFSYILHFVFLVWFGGGDSVGEAYATDPGKVYLVGRVVAAFFGVAGVWMLYVAGARLIDRATGLIAATLISVAFLPVFYAHQALNDVPSMLAVTVGIWAAAGILDSGRGTYYLLGGASVGVGAGLKYTAGIVLLTVVAAAVIRRYYVGRGSSRSTLRVRESSGENGVFTGSTALASRSSRGVLTRSTVISLVFIGLTALIVFVVVNPYSLLDFNGFWDGVAHQQSASNNEGGKLGAADDNGLTYYLWTLTWGFGWIPTLLLPVGMVLLFKRDRRLASLLVPAPLVFTLFMGMQGRFYGRWLLQIYPFLALISAFAAVWIWRQVAGRSRNRSFQLSAAVILSILLFGQGLIYTVSNDRVLAKKDTRGQLRDWMQVNINQRDKVLVEPIVPAVWFDNDYRKYSETQRIKRWSKILTSRAVVVDGKLVEESHSEGGSSDDEILSREDYGFTLHPDLIDDYEQRAVCYVVIGSTQKDRSYAEPERTPSAIDYYNELERRSTVVKEFSPYDQGEGPVKFNFDWSFDYYPFTYDRPGPYITVYALKGGRCQERRDQQPK